MRSPHSAWFTNVNERSNAVDAFELRTASRNAAPRTSKLRNWSKDAQAGDSSTTGSVSADGRGVARRRADRAVERAGDHERHLALQRRRRTRPPPRRSGRPCGCAGRSRRGDVMPPVFGLPPAIQKMSVKLASACAAASALVALESLTKSTLPVRPTSSMRCARPGNDRRPRWIASGDEAERERRGGAQAAFCALCAPRSEPMPASCATGARGAARGAHHLIAPRRRGRRESGRRAETRTTRLPARLDAVGDRLAPVVVDADDRGAAAHAGDQPLLDRGVVLQACRGGRDGPAVTLSRMPTEGSSDGARSIWKDEHSITWTRPGAGGSEREDRGADIAAELRVVARAARGDARSAPSWSTCRWCR